MPSAGVPLAMTSCGEQQNGSACKCDCDAVAATRTSEAVVCHACKAAPADTRVKAERKDVGRPILQGVLATWPTVKAQRGCINTAQVAHRIQGGGHEPGLRVHALLAAARVGAPAAALEADHPAAGAAAAAGPEVVRGCGRIRSSSVTAGCEVRAAACRNAQQGASRMFCRTHCCGTLREVCLREEIERAEQDLWKSRHLTSRRCRLPRGRWC